MPDYVTNTACSIPLKLGGVKPDVDFNGLKFNYDVGFFYDPPAPTHPWSDPPPKASQQ